MKHIFISILFLISLNAWSQDNDKLSQTFRGTVIDKVSQMTLPGASVVILNTNPAMGTTTDMDGEFKLEAVPLGRHDIEFSFLGYERLVLRNMLLVSGKELILTVEMEEQAFVTEEVVVKANARKDETINKMATVSARSFSVEETEKYAGSLGDPSRMASNFAGVAMVNDTRNDIIIRGNSPSGLLWRLDGIEIPNPNHFGASGTTGGPVSILNNNLLSNSDFFTSAFPSEYGNAISGVFDLKMRSGNNQKREHVGQIGFNGFELGTEGPFSKNSKASYLINYRYSTTGLMKAMGVDMGIGAAIPQYQDLTFKLDLPTKKAGRFSLLGMGGLSYIELNDSEKNMEDLDQGYMGGGVDLHFGSDMGVLGLSHLYFFDEKTHIRSYVSVQGSRSSTEIDSLEFDNKGVYIEDSNYRFYASSTSEIKYSASTHLKKKFNSRNNAVAGIYYDLYDINYIDSSKVSGQNLFERNYDSGGQISLIRAYLHWQHKFSNDLSMSSGLYSQYADISKEATLEPRIGFKYKLSGSQSLSIGYGLHSQVPAKIYYFIQTKQADNTYIQTNRNMEMMKSHQIVLSYDQLLAENFRLKSEVYYQYLFDVPVSKSLEAYSLINTGSDFGGLLPDSLVNEGTGKNYGIELTIEKFLSNNFYFLTTASIFQSRYSTFDKLERNTAYNNNYIFNALGGYEFKLGKKGSIDFNLKLVYAGGRPYIPIDLEQSKIDNLTSYDWDRAYDQKYDDYFRFDARIAYKRNGKKMSQEWAIDLKNISNHQNIYSESYNPRTQRLTRDYQTGFFPMFLYRVRF